MPIIVWVLQQAEHPIVSTDSIAEDERMTMRCFKRQSFQEEQIMNSGSTGYTENDAESTNIQTLKCRDHTLSNAIFVSFVDIWKRYTGRRRHTQKQTKLNSWQMKKEPLATKVMSKHAWQLQLPLFKLTLSYSLRVLVSVATNKTAHKVAELLAIETIMLCHIRKCDHANTKVYESGIVHLMLSVMEKYV